MRNRLSVRRRRLREPRYFIGLTVGSGIHQPAADTTGAAAAYWREVCRSLDEAGMALGVLGAASVAGGDCRGLDSSRQRPAGADVLEG